MVAWDMYFQPASGSSDLARYVRWGWNRMTMLGQFMLLEIDPQTSDERGTARVVSTVISPLCRVVLGISAILWSTPAHAQQASYSGANVTGALSFVRVVNLTQQAQPSMLRAFRAAPVSEVIRLTPPRLTPLGASLPSTPSKATSRMSARVSTAAAATPSVTGLVFSPAGGTFGFNALSHLDQRLANNGNQFSIEPPNPSVAVGNGYLLEGVNNAVQIYNTAGTPLLPSVLASNQVFGLAPTLDRATMTYGVYLTDMRVYFDQGMNRWLIVQRSQDNDSFGNNLPSSHLYVAVSQTPDPTGNYNIYVMDTTNSGNPGCPCIADYPQIGSDQYGLHIAWNEFSYFAGNYFFVDAAVLVVSKASLAGGVAAPTAVRFLLPYSSGFEFSLQPATTAPGASNFLASGGIEFFVSTFFGSGSQVALWAMTNTSSLSTPNPNPMLIRATTPCLPYFIPGVARQRPGPTPYGSSLFPPEPLQFLDGGDVRVQALSYAAGRLYLTFATGILDELRQVVVGGAYVVLSPTYRGGALAGQVLNQGYLVVNGNDLLRPAIAVNAQGNGAIAVTLAGVDWYPTAALIPFRSSTVPSSIQISALGALPEDGFTGYSTGGGFGQARWGDYNTAVAAGDGSIWMVAQYIGLYPRSEVANWNTYIFRKQP